MFLTTSQIVESVKRLEHISPFYGITFLAAKGAELPVGSVKEFQIDAANNEFLKTYYRPDKSSRYFYRVFRPSDKSKHWYDPGYAIKGLQSINTRTFGNAFIHPKNTSIWGWKSNYIDVLENHLGSNKIPIVDLAVWLYREKNWPKGTTAQDIVNTFKSEFKINDEEAARLYTFPALLGELDFSESLQEKPVSWQELSEELDVNPVPDFKPEEGGILRSLAIQGVGPAKTLNFEPAKRLSLITGDNGLGKTFLLECAWWALTGDWAEQAAYPRSDAKREEPKISFLITGEKKSKPTVVHYDRLSSTWPPPEKRPAIPGLIVYARVDGSFAVWDPMMNRHLLDNSRVGSATSQSLVFTKDQIWSLSTTGKMAGLLYDWILWQIRPDRKEIFDTLQKILRRLSARNFILEPGAPIRLSGSPVEIPTLKHPYGEVPIVFESAGVRRIITLAYLIVWAWNEHKIYSGNARKEPESNLVILVDEIEAHLHPQWQRSILPALLDVWEDLSDELQVQLMVATHSPLVAASVEPFFDQDKDKLFHLDLSANGDVELEDLKFLKHGPIDSWLTSDVFNLKQARSLEAEQAITEAMALQEKETPLQEEVQEVSNKLLKYLPADDEFWPRWLYFAELNGVEI